MGRYKDLLNKRRIWYKNIGKIYCPILRQDVFFTSKGFHHLRYQGGKARSIKEQTYKLGLLPLVIPVIKQAKGIFRHGGIPIQDSGKEAEFWVLKEVVGQQKTSVKVILRRVGTGKTIFFSVMKKNDKKKRMLSKVKKTIFRKR